MLGTSIDGVQKQGNLCNLNDDDDDDDVPSAQIRFIIER
jgi:hypothetical protein